VATPVEFIPSGAYPNTPSWMMGPWTKTAQPIINPFESGFASRNIYNMATIRENGITKMIFRGEDKAEKAGAITGRLGLATSQDGIHFDFRKEPVLVPQEPYESHGVEDPRLIKVDSLYYLTYTAYDGQVARLCMATSSDLITWKRHGALFEKFPPTKNWSKSGAIFNQRLESGPHKGKYVMYFGDTKIWLGVSDDLLHWKCPSYEPVFGTRPGMFDSMLVEAGPPPIATRDGILLIYNSADKDTHYAASAILLDYEHPDKVLHRLDRPFLQPTQQWEIEGYVNHVVFAEGLTHQDGKWHLYYGGADCHIGLAEAPFNAQLLHSKAEKI
jgi:predicted GH43/DUF377 family glycosyl hydrolase